MAFVAHPVEWLLPLPVALVALLIALAGLGLAWRWRGRALLLVLAIWATTLSIPALANQWITALEGPISDPATRPVDADPDTVIIVPGSGQPNPNQPGAQLDLAGYERLHSAVDLWRRTGGRLVFAGGLADDPALSLAARMRARAIELGVPPTAIAIVPDSSDTHQDLTGAAARLREAGGGNRPVWVVTSALHMARALASAQAAGLLDARPWPCDFRQLTRLSWRGWLPNNGGPALFAQALYESIGLVYYRWRHHAST